MIRKQQHRRYIAQVLLGIFPLLLIVMSLHELVLHRGLDTSTHECHDSAAQTHQQLQSKCELCDFAFFPLAIELGDSSAEPQEYLFCELDYPCLTVAPRGSYTDQYHLRGPPSSTTTPV